MENRIAVTAQGRVRGVACKNPEITVFKGVPYAKPPVGPLRWRAPEPMDAWNGIREANNFGAMPPQRRGAFLDLGLFDDMYCSEDVLYLNIWTPAKTADEKLPVLVWIHGGGLTSGYASDGMYDGEKYAEKGVILVTVSYRLGAFGFMCHKDMRAESPYGTSGNFGVMDQAAALRWVHDNIAGFGGDPEKVTIAGQSAGGGSVCNMMCTPLAAGTFRGAICQSGDSLAHRGRPDRFTMEAAEELGAKIAAHFGCETLDELRKIPFDQFVRKDYEVNMAVANARFGVVVDGVVLPKQPAEMLMHGEGQSNIPMIFGCNTREGLFGISGKSLEAYQNDIHAYFGDMAGAVLEAYPAASDEEAAQQSWELSCDMWVARLRHWGLTRKERGVPSWQYLFNRGKIFKGIDIGPRHGEEMSFVFGTGEHWMDCFEVVLANVPKPEGYDGTADAAIDAELSERMMNHWANFVKTGNPNGDAQQIWKPVAEDTLYMWLDAESGMRCEQKHGIDVLVAETAANWAK